MPSPADPAGRLLFATWDGPGADHLTGLFAPTLTAVVGPGGRVEVVQGLRRGAALARPDAVVPGVRRHALTEPTAPAWVGRAGRLLAVALLLIRFRRGLARSLARSLDGAEGPTCLVTRSVVPGTVARTLAARRRVPWLHDADGHVAEQRADFDGWRRGGLRHTVVHRLEAACAARADHVVVRTPWAAQDLAPRTGRPLTDFTVVPNGRDGNTFRPRAEADRRAVRADLDIPADVRVLAYAGALAPRQRPAAIGALLDDAIDRGWHVLLLTADIDDLAALGMQRPGDPALHVRTASPADVPRLLAAADAAVALQVDATSTRTVALTKLGEALLCGLPVIADAAAHHQVGSLVDAGVAVPGGLPAAEALDRLVALLADPEVHDRARQEGLARFDLAVAVTQWRRAVAVTQARGRPDTGPDRRPPVANTEGDR